MDEADISQREIEHQLKITLNNMEAEHANKATNSAVTECVSCGDFIPKARREAIIGCQYCVSCAELNERKTGGIKRV